MKVSSFISLTVIGCVTGALATPIVQQAQTNGQPPAILDASPSARGPSNGPPVGKAASIHGQQVTDSCYEAYRSTFLKTMAVTDAVHVLVNATRTVQVLRVPGLAAWKASSEAQETFTKINQKLDESLTEDDHAELTQARNEEIVVSVFIGLVIHNASSLSPDQTKALTQFQSTAQAERVGRLLVEQSCPELSQAIDASQLSDR